MKWNLSKYFGSEDVFKKPSIIFLIFCVCFAFWFVDFWAPYNSLKNGSSFQWDIFNYYSYLPAYFCNNGSFEFEPFIPNDFNPVGPLKTHLPKTTYGMSVMYAPFFAIAYKIAYNTGTPLNGFTREFVDLVHLGSIFYVIMGLFFLRKLLLVYFNETVTTITLFSVLFGSMLFMYTFSSSESAHGYLFCLFSIFLWLTYKWHLESKWSTTLAIGFVIGLISLIRPTEIIIVLFFIFWNVKTPQELLLKFRFFLSKYLHFVLIAAMGILIWIPQFIFWKHHTGNYLYFSYPGERFFWNDPQIFNILFSYRKGWITYTPLVVMAFVGFFFVKKDFPISKGLFVFLTALSVYVLSCWWDWFFGGCFGARGFCQNIAYLSFPIAFLIDAALFSLKKIPFKGLLSLIVMAYVFSCVCLNVGQSYNYLHRKISPNAMSEKLYWEVFRTYNFKDDFHDTYWVYADEPDYEKLRSGEDRTQ